MVIETSNSTSPPVDAEPDVASKGVELGKLIKRKAVLKRANSARAVHPVGSQASAAPPLNTRSARVAGTGGSPGGARSTVNITSVEGSANQAAVGRAGVYFPRLLEQVMSSLSSSATGGDIVDKFNAVLKEKGIDSGDPRIMSAYHSHASGVTHRAVALPAESEQGFWKEHVIVKNNFTKDENDIIGFIKLAAHVNNPNNTNYPIVQIGSHAFATDGQDNIVDKDGNPTNFKIKFPAGAEVGALFPSIVDRTENTALSSLFEARTALTSVNKFLANDMPQLSNSAPVFEGANVNFGVGELDGAKVFELTESDGSVVLRSAGVKSVKIDSTFQGQVTDHNSFGKDLLAKVKSNYSWVAAPVNYIRGSSDEVDSSQSAVETPSGRATSLLKSKDRLGADDADTVRFVVKYEHGGTDKIDVQKKGDDGSYSLHRKLEFVRLMNSNASTVDAAFNYDGRATEGALVGAGGSKMPIATTVLDKASFSNPSAHLSHLVHQSIGAVTPGAARGLLIAGVHGLVTMPLGLEMVKGGAQLSNLVITAATGRAPVSYLGTGPNPEAVAGILDTVIPILEVSKQARFAAAAAGYAKTSSAMEVLSNQIVIPLLANYLAVSLGATASWKQAAVGGMLPNLITIAGQQISDAYVDRGMSPQASNLLQSAIRIVLYGGASGVLQYATMPDDGEVPKDWKTQQALIIANMLFECVTMTRQVVSTAVGAYTDNDNLLNNQIVKDLGADPSKENRSSFLHQARASHDIGKFVHALADPVSDWIGSKVKGKTEKSAESSDGRSRLEDLSTLIDANLDKEAQPTRAATADAAATADLEQISKAPAEINTRSDADEEKYSEASSEAKSAIENIEGLGDMAEMIALNPDSFESVQNASLIAAGVLTGIADAMKPSTSTE